MMVSSIFLSLLHGVSSIGVVPPRGAYIYPRSADDRPIECSNTWTDISSQRGGHRLRQRCSIPDAHFLSQGNLVQENHRSPMLWHTNSNWAVLVARPITSRTTIENGLYRYDAIGQITRSDSG